MVCALLNGTKVIDLDFELYAKNSFFGLVAAWAMIFHKYIFVYISPSLQQNAGFSQVTVLNLWKVIPDSFCHMLNLQT